MVNQDIQRVTADNPSPMTGTGTNSYVLTAGDDCIILDPGPDLDRHVAALIGAVAGRRLLGVVVTHAHLDHSQVARRLGHLLDAPTLAFGTASSGRSQVMTLLAKGGLIAGVEGLDLDFIPDECLSDGQEIPFGGTHLTVLHCPGHLGGHLCLEWGSTLFTGDHVMAWSTSLVSPPDGDMAAYMAALRRLRALNRWDVFLPGHGAEIVFPARRLDDLIAHRTGRETAILTALGIEAQTGDQLTHRLYTDTPSPLIPAARRNVLAHLIALWESGHVICDAPLREHSLFALGPKAD